MVVSVRPRNEIKVNENNVFLYFSLMSSEASEEEDRVWVFLRGPLRRDIELILEQLDVDCTGDLEMEFNNGISTEYHEYDSYTRYENAVRIDGPKDKLEGIKAMNEELKNEHGFISNFNLIWLMIYVKNIE